MPAGFVQRDPASGQITFDLQDAGIGRPLGEFSVTTDAGSLTDNRLLSGQGFVVPKVPYQFTSKRVFTFSGNTLSWSAAPSGPSAYFYGVGKATNPNYASTHVPGTPGFRVRDDAGNFVVDETFFTYHFIGKVSGAHPGGVAPFLIPYAPENLPIFATRTGEPVVVLAASNTTNGPALTLRGAACAVTIYFFGTIDRVPSQLFGGIGKRWRVNGQIAGDSSVPFLKIVDTRVWGGSDWGGALRLVPGAKPGRSYALMVHSPGEHIQQFPGSGLGSGGRVDIRLAAGMVTSSGGEDYPYMQSILLSSNPGGSVNSNTFVDGLYSLVDVTGM